MTVQDLSLILLSLSALGREHVLVAPSRGKRLCLS